eukprot:1695456-Rhodomonas_salina.3
MEPKGISGTLAPGSTIRYVSTGLDTLRQYRTWRSSGVGCWLPGTRVLTQTSMTDACVTSSVVVPAHR